MDSFGIYSVLVTDSNNCFASDTTEISFHPIPVVSFSGLDSIYCNIDPIDTLIGFPSGGSFWGPGIQGNLFDPGLAQIGLDTIIYSYTDNFGCSAQYVSVTSVDVCQLIENSENPSFVLFPNPNRGSFIISGMKSSATVYVFNVIGELLFQSNGVINSQLISIPNLPGGLYFLMIRSEGNEGVAKFLVE